MYYIYVWKTASRQWKPSTMRLINQSGYSNLNDAHAAMNKASARYNYVYRYIVVESGTYVANIPAPQ